MPYPYGYQQPYSVAHAPPMYTAPTPSVPGKPLDWQVYTTTDGRKYYFNRVTKVTQWECPPELLEAEKNVRQNVYRTKILTLDRA